MDYKGQQLSELIFQIIIVLFGSVGWIYGYMEQDFMIVFQCWVVGVLISVLLCVPDWPFYNRHPVKWLESVPNRSHAKSS